MESASGKFSSLIKQTVLTTLLATFLLSSNSLFANGDENQQANVPLHPSQIIANFNGVDYKLLNAKGKKGVIEVNDKTISVPTKKLRFSISRAPDYSNGYITLTEQDFSFTKFTSVSAGGTTIGGGLNSGTAGQSYSTRFSSTEDLENCYAVLALVPRHQLSTPALSLNSIFLIKEIGDISKNKNKRIRFDLAHMDRYVLMSKSPIPMFFSNNKEVRTNMTESLSYLAHHNERIDHRRQVLKYITKANTEDQSPKSFLIFNPIATSTDRLTEYPDKVAATLFINEMGYLTDYELKATLPDFVTIDLDRDLKGFLFMPAIESGKPVPSQANITLQFSQ